MNKEQFIGVCPETVCKRFRVKAICRPGCKCRGCGSEMVRVELAPTDEPILVNKKVKNLRKTNDNLLKQVEEFDLAIREYRKRIHELETLVCDQLMALREAKK